MDGILSEHIDVDILSEDADDLHLFGGHGSCLSADNFCDFAHFLRTIKLSDKDFVFLKHVDYGACK